MRYSLVAGGYANSIRSNASFALVGSGSGNTIQQGAQYSLIVGGTDNAIQAGALCSAVLGGWRNVVYSNAESSVVAGGFRNAVFVDADYATVGGGHGNSIGSRAAGASVAGGVSNVVHAGAQHSFIGGGTGNSIRNFSAGSFLGGGFDNVVQSNTYYAAIGGGAGNFAAGHFATVPGGTRARANHAGAFVWSGVNSVDTASTNANSFTVRAPGGVRFITTVGTNFVATNNGVQLLPQATAWTVLSDRESKTDFQPIKPREVLSKLASMPVTSWKYKHDPSRRYIGPTSQDFMAAFHLGDYDKGINTLDADGVTFAAIQGLIEELKERDRAMAERDKAMGLRDQTIEELRLKLQALEQRLNSLPPAQ